MDDIKKIDNNDLKEVTGGGIEINSRRERIKIEKYESIDFNQFYTNLPDFSTASEVVYRAYEYGISDCKCFKGDLRIYGDNINIRCVRHSDSDCFFLDQETFKQKYPYHVIGEFRW